MTNVLISGGGIAGLTLGILLKEAGFEPLVIEREPRLRTEGYMMDFFGSGWDVAERMGLVPQLRAIHYPIDSMQFVDDHGETYVSVPIDVVRRALGGKYVYLRRSDLEHILYERAVASGVAIRFGASIAALAQDDGQGHCHLRGWRRSVLRSRVRRRRRALQGADAGVRRRASVRSLSRRLCRRVPSQGSPLRPRPRAEAL